MDVVEDGEWQDGREKIGRGMTVNGKLETIDVYFKKNFFLLSFRHREGAEGERDSMLHSLDLCGSWDSRCELIEI